MKVRQGEGTTEFGRGVFVELSGDELATAIDAYLVAHHVYVIGPRTIRIGGRLPADTSIYVDPEGSVIFEEERYSGRTGEPESVFRRKV